MSVSTTYSCGYSKTKKFEEDLIKYNLKYHTNFNNRISIITSIIPIE